jgi:hypothetical protein
LCESESLGKLLLGEACLLSERVETLTERSSFACGWSAGFHVGSIGHPDLNTTEIYTHIELQDLQQAIESAANKP